MSWLKSKYAIAAHIGLVYVGVSWYVQSIVKDIQKQKMLQQDVQTAGANEQQNSEVKKSAAIIPVIKRDFNQLAPQYDQLLKWDELVMGLNIFRRLLLRHAKGDVLEVAVGTGRNIPYYPSTKYIKSVTFLDQSYNMLEQTIKKFNHYQRNFYYSDKKEIPSQFIKSSMTSLDFPENSFDTVIDTFGLCSVSTDCNQENYTDVIKALNEMARVCKPDGVVLLLEHGKSSYQWLNKILDRDASIHFDKWSCWWNRDISKLIAMSNLEVIYQSRWHFGTTYYVICKPKK